MAKCICTLRRILTAFLIIFILVPAMDISALATGRRLTIMVYMTGSDLETENGLASGDIREMLRAHKDSENVTVLVMIGGAKEWHGTYPSDRSVIYELADGKPVEVWSDGLMNMGKPETLTTLIDFGYENYPADDYALILWNHGSGPLGGVCFDEAHTSWGSSDGLDMPELRTALEKSACAGKPLEWIGFDACLMASIETAFVCAPYATYMIASQETEPGSGWDYSFLTDIANDPSGAVTGIRIVDAYYDSFDGMYDQVSVTLSCIDLRKISAVETAMDDVFGQLNSSLSISSFSAMSNLRRDARSIGRTSTGSEYDLVDLYHLSQLYTGQLSGSSDELMSAIDGAIIYSRSNIPDVNGLSVYFPYYNKDYFEYGWHDEFNRIGFSKGYTDYMDGYADIWLSGSLSNWQGMQSFIAETSPDTSDTLFTMELTDDQAANYTGAQLYVMAYDEPLELYSFVYSTDEVTLDGTTLSAAYNNTALYVLDSEGNPLSGSLEYKKVEDTYMLRAVLCKGEDMFSGDTLPVYIQMKVIEGTDELEVVGVIEVTGDDQLTTGKQSVTLDPEIWKNIYIAKYPVYLTRDENGEMLPFTQWDDSSWVFADLFSNEEEWSVRFVEESYVTEDFATMFVVTDTQGNQYGSELTFIENKNVEPLDIQPVTLADNENITATLTGASLSHASYDPGIILHVELTNNTDKEMLVYVNDFLAGDIAIDDGRTVADNIQPGETVKSSIMLYSYIMRDALVTAIPSLSFNMELFESSEMEMIEDIRVTIDQEFDVSALFEDFEMPLLPENTPEEGVLSVDLFGASIEADGTLSCWLRYANNTDSDYDTYVDTAAINGCFISGVINHSFWVPAGKTAYEKIIFAPEPPAYDFYYYSIPPVTDPLAYWGIDSIEDIQLQIYDEEYVFSYVDVNIPEPIIVNSNSVVHADESLYSGSGINIIRRGEVYVEDDYLNIMLVAENTSGGTISIAPANGRIGDSSVYVRASADVNNSAYTYLSGIELPDGTSSRYLIGLEISALDTSADAATLQFELICTIGAGKVTIPVAIHLPAGTVLGDLMPE